MAKFIKHERFLAEDEDENVIGEADTYEEGHAFGGRVIDTQNGQEEGGLFQSRKITSAYGGNIVDCRFYD